MSFPYVQGRYLCTKHVLTFHCCKMHRTQCDVAVRSNSSDIVPFLSLAEYRLKQACSMSTIETESNVVQLKGKSGLLLSEISVFYSSEEAVLSGNLMEIGEGWTTQAPLWKVRKGHRAESCLSWNVSQLTIPHRIVLLFSMYSMWTRVLCHATTQKSSLQRNIQSVGQMNSFPYSFPVTCVVLWSMKSIPGKPYRRTTLLSFKNE